MHRIIVTLFGMTLLVAAGQVIAACSVSSSSTTPHLLELYTSEGCSSCPPAEQWYRGLRANDQIVPLEFHVDYWNDLGWTDRYARHAYTLRQQRIVAHGGNEIVYTPEVAIDGREWREWSRSNLPPAEPAPFVLRLDIDTTNDVMGRLSVLGTRISPSGYEAYFALVEDNLLSNVSAGENNGRKLQHDHVVREIVGPVALSQAQARLMVPADGVLANTSVVAYVTRGSDGTPVQVLEHGLEGCIQR